MLLTKGGGYTVTNIIIKEDVMMRSKKPGSKKPEKAMSPKRPEEGPKN